MATLMGVLAGVLIGPAVWWLLMYLGSMIDRKGGR
jgi:hypothetical protein